MSSFNSIASIEQNDSFFRHLLDNPPSTDSKTKSLPSLVCAVKWGWLYLFQYPSEEDVYKIGLTYNLKARLSQFQVCYPMDVCFAHTFRCDDPETAERRLLDAFEPDRIRGEWFALSRSGLLYIKSIRKYEKDRKSTR